ncbi:MAG: CoB--CoM heterodisulfide reductase iron-sulfur subunit A family protein [Eubacteriales bacterium]|nr:CoB--CoM heterodisulfide reductase iron-sulfur subunit A family protein [Eubacteriales bacterium]
MGKLQNNRVLIIGGGVAGIQAALDSAEMGYHVDLIEKSPSLGGDMAKLDKTFPTNDCSMCILAPRLVSVARHPNINVLTSTNVMEITGEAGDFKVRIFKKARYVDLDKCTGCGACSQVCPVKIEDEYNQNLCKTKNIYIPYPQAVPLAALINPEHCLYLTKNKCRACEKICTAKAIDFTQIDEEITLNTGAIIFATGTKLFNAGEKNEYGYGKFPNVITSMEMERILSASGPTSGEVVRLSDKKHPRKIAFIQCVGSRDSSCGKEYCSSVCCMYATKEANIIKEHNPDIEISIFFMDMRAYGKDFERYYEKAKNELNINYIRSIPSGVEEVGREKDLLLNYDTPEGETKKEVFNMVVLSVGLTPSPEFKNLFRKTGIKLNKNGFCRTVFDKPLKTSREGIFVCGTFQGPKDIPETVVQASGAAAEVAEILSAPENSNHEISKIGIDDNNDLINTKPRIGVFVCHCGINIGGIVDVPKVTEYARDLKNVVFAMDNMYSCSQDTQEVIKQKIKKYGLNRVIVASCSPRTHEALFQQTLKEAGLNKYLFEMVNIRDQCSWVHSREPGKATDKAKDLVRMGVAKANRLEPLQEISLNVNHQGLVIGGGIAGMEAALSLARQGYKVYLIEKEHTLGGNLNNLSFDPDGNDLEEYFNAIKYEVSNNSNIQLFTDSMVNKVDGFVGNFTTIIQQKKEKKIEEIKVEHGIIIVATGAKEYLGKDYLYSKNKNVLTQLQLSQRLKKNDIELNNKTIVMIQCVGSRDEQHPYCSRVCCQQAIQNTLKIKEKYPDANIYVLYRDIRTYGLIEEYYTKSRKMGVIFIKYEEDKRPEVKEVTDSNRRKKLEVSIWNAMLQSKINIKADIIALSSGIVAPDDNHKIAQMLKVPINSDGFFLEAHVKLRPVDFSTEGIFVCGLAHSPKNIEESIAQAKAAASRAAQILSKESITTSGIVASVNDEICAGCGLCTVVCPYGAIEIDEIDNVAKVNPALCKGCGTCCATCPAGALELKGFRKKQILSMIDILAEV